MEAGTYHNVRHGSYHTQAVGAEVAARGTSWVDSDPSSLTPKLSRSTAFTCTTMDVPVATRET